jgi:hypothetical protein
MQLPRLRFTLGQLIAFVGATAVFCFFLTTRYWLIAPAIAIVAPSFLLDRRKDGAGILGAMLAGILGFSGIGLGFYVYLSFGGDASALGQTGPGAWLTYVGLAGLVCGTIFGLSTWSVLFLLGLADVLKPPQVESRGSVIRHGRGDRGLTPSRTGLPQT